MTIVATLWQFMSRSDMTRDNMSQALEAWGLGLFFIIQAKLKAKVLYRFTVALS